MIDLEAIEKRNELRKRYAAIGNCYDCEGLPAPMAERDIDALIAEVRRITEAPSCLCCATAAVRLVGSPLQCCEYCYNHCRAPRPIDPNWSHGTIP